MSGGAYEQQNGLMDAQGLLGAGGQANGRDQQTYSQAPVMLPPAFGGVQLNPTGSVDSIARHSDDAPSFSGTEHVCPPCTVRISTGRYLRPAPASTPVNPRRQ